MQKNNYSEKTNFGLMQLYPPQKVEDVVPAIICVNDTKKVEKTQKKMKKQRKKKHRCAHGECKKKLTPAQQEIICKCKSSFCCKHRFQSSHNCPDLNTYNEERFKKTCCLGGGNFKQVEVL